MKIYDTIIVGAGPAGLTAAIYLRRNEREVLVFEKESIGGQMSKSPKIENFPSFISISGEELADKMYNQAASLGVEFEFTEVMSVNKAFNYYVINNDYYAKSVLWAVGCEHKTLPNISGDHVHYCATCDGPFYKNKDVAVVGDGNSAAQYAIELSNYCNSVTLCTLFDKFFCEKTLEDRVKTKNNIKWIPNVKITSIESTSNDLSKINLESSNTSSENVHCQDILVSGIFVAIGQKPCNNALMTPEFIAAVDLSMFMLGNEEGRTFDKGLFVAGDCRKKAVRQVATAIGDGAAAAISINKYLES